MSKWTLVRGMKTNYVFKNSKIYCVFGNWVPTCNTSYYKGHLIKVNIEIIAVYPSATHCQNWHWRKHSYIPHSTTRWHSTTKNLVFQQAWQKLSKGNSFFHKATQHSHFYRGLPSYVISVSGESTTFIFSSVTTSSLEILTAGSIGITWGMRGLSDTAPVLFSTNTNTF